MNSKDIPYAARVNAAYYLIRKARKIARRLADTTSEQQQAIENEIAVIGMRMYSETCEEKQPEVTHDPEQDHELEAYVSAVRELVPDAERWFVANDYWHRFSVEQSAERWRNHVNYSTNQDHELEAYVAAVRELVPDIDEPKIKHYRDLGYTPEQAAKRWRGYCRFLQESKKL